MNDLGDNTVRFRLLDAAVEGFDSNPDEGDRLQADIGRWSELGGAGVRLAKATLKADLVDITLPILELLGALKRTQDAQSRLLSSIDENLKLLIHGPFNTGLLLLDEAEHLVDDPERWKPEIAGARKKFQEALGQVPPDSPVQMAAIKMHIGLTYLLENHPADAKRWIEDAYEEAAVASVNLVDGIEDVEVAPELPRKQRADAAYVGFELKSPRTCRARSKRGDRKAAARKCRSDLGEILPVVGCIVSLHQATTNDSRLLPLAVHKVKRKQFELVAVRAERTRPSRTGIPI